MSFDGNSVVITAGGSGLGRHIARQFLDQNAVVVVNDISDSALEDTHDTFPESDIRTVQGDASDPATAQQLLETAREETGTVDIVINNVGIAGPTKPCEEISYDEFMRTIEVNLGSMFTLSSQAIPSLRKSGGTMVNIASIAGKMPLLHRTPYATSKMGVIGFTRTVAKELAPDARANVICPGPVVGPRMDAVIEGQAESRNISQDEARSEFESDAALGQMVNPEHVADAVTFLASDRAASITGQDINVSNGSIMY